MRQEDELRAYCEKRALKVVGEYQDTMSGAKDSRPALQRLLADARARKFDAIVVWKIDRFGRSLRHLVNSLADLEVLGVAFISLRDSLDFTTPSGKLQFHVLAAVAEFERSLISERVRAGMRAATKRGKRSGRPRTSVDSLRVRELGGFFIGDYIEVFAHRGEAYVHYNANYRKIQLLGLGFPVNQQDNFLVKTRLDAEH